MDLRWSNVNLLTQPIYRLLNNAAIIRSTLCSNNPNYDALIY